MYYQPKRNLLDQKHILVTGAGDGIGREAALTYARHGASLLLLGRTEHKLNAVKQAIAEAGGRETRVLVLDLACADPLPYQLLAQRLMNELPHLDGLLNNAGLLGEVATMTEQTPARWSEVMAVNINGAFMLTQALLPLLLNAGGASLIFSTSSVGRQGRANWGAYSVSKFATEGMMQVLADEYPASTLRVNCINPGGTRTGMRASAYPAEDADRLKTPADIMPIYLYLMGDDSRRKTGISFDAQPDRKPGPAT
ncbi:YciK family oxidoreductase [Candidatus Sodalis endolongispinus]|uniref:YciK family oxidoreductase n=1 Tax=Candidatus Sodalis endolongispinus TaxID=2812662 RepID=A0ABS5YDX8_9GAMM|nr:YciK family oxidoreductase [Candidatus Sodalis endolongispinus]MBT9433239.1 YciK family oxidoreductase [Candidatus Sodalis endolongispinus]